MSREDVLNDWIGDISETLSLIKNEGVKTGSICRVPEKMREANKEKSEEWYRPKLVAMGPIHRGATIDLQTMELTKWRYADKLLIRLTPGDDLRRESCKDIKVTETIIRGSYGDTIHMGTEEFSRNMFLDACFLVELLLRLSENTETDPSDLGYLDDDKKLSRLLTDLILLENQVPFVLLKILSANLPLRKELASLIALCRGVLSFPKTLAESLFGCILAIADFRNDVCHFLHLIHLCFHDPYQHQDILSEHPFQLHRCARKLQAFGITISASRTTDYEGNINKPGTVASAQREFMDKFEFKIEFKETQRELIIPTLHIKEATEVRSRVAGNLIF